MFAMQTIRRANLNLILSSLVAVSVFQLAICAEGYEIRAKPNVVIVITDDQGYGDLSCHGNPILKTPQLDELYAESVRLTDYHVAPTCSPTRAALQTGHWTNRTGVWHTIMGRSMLRKNEITIGDVFKSAGYETCLLYTSPSPRDLSTSRMPSSA